MYERVALGLRGQGGLAGGAVTAAWGWRSWVVFSARIACYNSRPVQSTPDPRCFRQVCQTLGREGRPISGRTKATADGMSRRGLESIPGIRSPEGSTICYYQTYLRVALFLSPSGVYLGQVEFVEILWISARYTRMYWICHRVTTKTKFKRCQRCEGSRVPYTGYS